MRSTIFTLALFGVVTFSARSQQSQNLQKEIDEQVWKPFIQYYNVNDQEGFASVHSKDVVRVQQDDNRILSPAEYFRKPTEAEKSRLAERKISLELRFIQRIAENGKAFEVGYYKTTVTNLVKGTSRSSYGKFHVLLKKENNAWKIAMDADASDNTDETVFLTGKPIE
jgi:ketosteroid isomerase-like protein